MSTKRNSYLACAILIGATLTTFAAARTLPQAFGPHDYQSFVMNWTPDTAPLCAAMQSKADWDRIMHPAPTMDQSRPFAPPDDFWKTKALLLVANVVNAGNTDGVFQLDRVKRAHGAIEVDYAFHATPAASSTVKWYMAVAVPRPLANEVRFNQDGNVVCTLHPRAGAWAMPLPSGSRN